MGYYAPKDFVRNPELLEKVVEIFKGKLSLGWMDTKTEKVRFRPSHPDRGLVYDDTNSLFSARVWWSLRAYGFDSCRILDGGFPAWEAESRPVSNASAAPAPASFLPRAQLRLRLTTPDVRALLGSPEVLLLDARAPAEYHGHEGNTRRLGHIPGAVNVAVAAMTRPGSQHLRSAEELRAQLLRANVTRARRLVCYDGSGVAAAKLAFVLTLLGHDDVGVYDGGWAEWGDRLDLPVDR